MTDLNAGTWILAVVCAAILGMSKAGIAGLGMLSTPIMVSLFSAKQSMGILLPMLIVGDVFAVAYYHRHANWHMLTRLVPMAFAGIILGSFVMDRVTDSQLKTGIGIIVLIMVILTILRNRGIIADERIPKGWRIGVVTGLVAGVTTVLAHAAGPVMQVYLLAMGLKKNEFIGTAAWFFLLVNVFKVPFYFGHGWITTASLMLNLKIVIGIPFGIAAGIYVVSHLSNRKYTIWVQTLTALGALKLIFG